MKKEYKTSEKHREQVKRFRESPKGQAYIARQREYMKTWNKSEAARLSRLKYSQKPEAIEYRRLYDKSPKRIQYKKVYSQTEHFKELSRQKTARYRTTENGRNTELTYREWYDKLPHRRHRRRDDRIKLLEALGGKCVHCGIIDTRILDLDHIYNDGAKERKRFGNTSKEVRYYNKHIEEARTRLQVLCCNCNRLKCWEINEKEYYDFDYKQLT